MKASCIEFNIDMEDIVIVPALNVLTSSFVIGARVNNVDRAGEVLPMDEPTGLDTCHACGPNQIQVFITPMVRVVNNMVGGTASVASDPRQPLRARRRAKLLASSKERIATLWPLRQGRFFRWRSVEIVRQKQTERMRARRLSARYSALRSQPRWIETTSKIMRGRQTAPRTPRRPATSARVPQWSSRACDSRSVHGLEHPAWPADKRALRSSWPTQSFHCAG